jgi:GAF domain-containing protein
VEEFPGHIICDPSSRSELVIPIERNGGILGVLDLDSHQRGAFDETDLAEISSLLDRLGELPL